MAKLTLGGYDTSLIRKGILPDDLFWVQTPSDSSQWEIEIQDIQYGNFSIFNENSTKALINFAEPFIRVPYNDNMQTFLVSLRKKFFNVSVYCDTTCYFMQKCSYFHSRLNNLNILIGKWNFSIEPEDYMLDLTDKKGRNGCYLAIQPNYNGEFIFGQAFMRAYYTVLDEDRSQIGVGLNVQGKSWISLIQQEPVNPPDPIEPDQPVEPEKPH